MDDKDHTIQKGALAIEGEKIIAPGKKEDIEKRYTASEIIKLLCFGYLAFHIRRLFSLHD